MIKGDDTGAGVGGIMGVIIALIESQIVISVRDSFHKSYLSCGSLRGIEKR